MIDFFIVYFSYAINKSSTVIENYFLFLLLGAAAIPEFVNVIALITSMYASHKLALIIEVLNLI